LRNLEMAFLGKIAASMTHEIKNTYAIILESSGLLSDLLTFHQEGSFPHKEKFHKVLGTINDQVNRGVVIATRLNQFAHSMDEPRALVKVADLLELAVSLMQRLARRRGIELKAVAPDRDVSLKSDPFRLQLVLASVIEQLAEALESGGKIVLQSPPAPQGVTILLEVQGLKKAGWEGLSENLFASLKDILEALGAELAVSSPPALEGVMLTIKTPGP
jgi:C4-dicarboxylate-specific signal transduction histidine kinase